MLKVMNMPGMHDVEAAVAMDDRPACLARLLTRSQQFIERADFAIDVHAISPLVHRPGDGKIVRLLDESLERRHKMAR